MHPHHTTRRRALTAVIAAGITIGTLSLPGTVDAATAATESPVVADSASAALAALERWHETSHPADFVAFRADRERAATTIAAELGVSPDALLAEWEAADEGKQVAMLSALTQLGVPYRSMASKEGVGFDCSGLTTWAFRQAGVELPRISRDQIRSADEVELATAEPGDLTYYPGHVSIYIGQGLVVHSPNSGNRVEVRALARRTNAFGDAFTDELVVDENPLGDSTTTSLPDAVDPTAAPRRLWHRYL
jgi:cell wall-associated NlpC family hydrolase